jgi:type VI protein secretion system component Hcp
VQKHRFTGGQAVVRSGAGAQPQESVSFTYGKLNVNYVQQGSGQGSGIDSASFGWE